MYGFVDAPVLWQLALLLFLKSICKGTSSCFDDNFLYWTDGHQLVMVFTLHVDDILAVGLSDWLLWARGLLEKRFGAVKRSVLPFTHNGMDYSVLPNGAILMSQNKHLEQIAAVLVPHDAKDDDALTPALQSAFRGLLCAMLWDTQCRPDILCEVVQLQSHNINATIANLKQANTCLKRGQLSCGTNTGLHFLPLQLPLKLV